MGNSGNVSLYVHVPFCRSKCPYCAFYSFRPQGGDYELWTRCAVKELQVLSEKLGQHKKLTTIYFGGGTPSLMPKENWKEIFRALEQLPRDEACEFTVEANPESVSNEKLLLWQDHGVNRISLGVQSLNDTELKVMARRHNAQQALQALEMCCRNGFRSSADLMFALPAQTFRSWHNSLRTLVHAGVQHISLYQLTLEPDSYWGSHEPEGLPDGYQMYRWAQYYLRQKGLRQYEIASFASEGQESRHNLVYWHRGDVYAVGPGAWGFVDGVRFAKFKELVSWAKKVDEGGDAVEYTENLLGPRAAAEAAVLALRTADGISFDDFAFRYGEQYLSQIVKRLRAMPLRHIIWRDDGVALSACGMRVGNSIWSELIDLESDEEDE